MDRSGVGKTEKVPSCTDKRFRVITTRNGVEFLVRLCNILPWVYESASCPPMNRHLTKTTREAGEGNLQLRTADGCSDTQMKPTPKCNVRIGVPCQVDAMRCGKYFGIVICGSQSDPDTLPLSNDSTPEFNVLRGESATE